MNADPTSIDRLMELLADRATNGLSDAEQAELTRLQAKWPHIDESTFDDVAAMLAMNVPAEPMPARLRRAVEREALVHFAAPARRQVGWKVAAVLGWLATAACLTLAVLFNRGPSPELARERMLANSGTTQVAAANAAGDVVWSNSEQVGYLKLVGLPINDPAKEQYQLWIFDKKRDERYPVDGGVFDVKAGVAVVPVKATVRVDVPTLFAVTVERPGGVVVSDRSRIVWTAANNLPPP